MICLQEAFRYQSGILAKDLKYVNYESWMSCSILSKVPFKLYEWVIICFLLRLGKLPRKCLSWFRRNGKARFLTVQINLDDNCPLFLTCLHLNHVTEKKRLSEIESIKKHLDPVFREGHCQIWAGDFNALSKEDYSESSWNNITEVRKRNCWESPKVELTTKVRIIILLKNIFFT